MKCKKGKRVEFSFVNTFFKTIYFDIKHTYFPYLFLITIIDIVITKAIKIERDPVTKI